MELLGIGGFIFAATALSVLIFEHQADVLHGPYIEGRAPKRVANEILASEIFDPLRALAEPVIDRLNWKARHAVYLASLA